MLGFLHDVAASGVFFLAVWSGCLAFGLSALPLSPPSPPTVRVPGKLCGTSSGRPSSPKPCNCPRFRNPVQRSATEPVTHGRRGKVSGFSRMCRSIPTILTVRKRALPPQCAGPRMSIRSVPRSLNARLEVRVLSETVTVEGAADDLFWRILRRFHLKQSGATIPSKLPRSKSSVSPLISLVLPWASPGIAEPDSNGFFSRKNGWEHAGKPRFPRRRQPINRPTSQKVFSRQPDPRGFPFDRWRSSRGAHHPLSMARRRRPALMYGHARAKA